MPEMDPTTAKPWRRGLRTAVIMVLAMVATALMAFAARPIYKLSETRPRISFEELIPRQFGQWREVKAGALVLANPQAVAALDRIYTQLLSRTYINLQGTAVMLSLAYGDDQRAAMAVHYPEVCYPAQGFAVRSSRPDRVRTGSGEIPVRRLETTLGRERFEPVTYWTTIGDKVSLGGLEKRLLELDYGLKRQIPDGLLFRVSSINRDTPRAFEDQDQFVRELLLAVDGNAQRWLVGASLPAASN
jgi:EpsI family protein